MFVEFFDCFVVLVCLRLQLLLLLRDGLLFTTLLFELAKRVVVLSIDRHEIVVVIVTQDCDLLLLSIEQCVHFG